MMTGTEKFPHLSLIIQFSNIIHLGKPDYIEEKFPRTESHIKQRNQKRDYYNKRHLKCIVSIKGKNLSPSEGFRSMYKTIGLDMARTTEPELFYTRNVV